MLADLLPEPLLNGMFIEEAWKAGLTPSSVAADEVRKRPKARQSDGRRCSTRQQPGRKVKAP